MMMDGVNVFELVFYAIIAGVLIYRLNSMLGTRPDNDVKPPQGGAGMENDDAAAAVPQSREVLQLKEDGNRMAQEIERKIQADAPLNDKLTNLRTRFPDFDAVSFLQGAKAAFELITSSFAKGDLAAMHGLVSDNVYSSYKNIIDERARAEQTLEFEIIRFIDAEIKDASMEDAHRAKIQVGFTTEQVNVLKDKDGKVISGSDSFINKVHDLWSFTRDVRSANPNWALVAAKSG